MTDQDPQALRLHPAPPPGTPAGEAHEVAEPTDATEPTDADEATDATDATDADDADEAEPGQGGKEAREAAKYRRRLRVVEEERDALLTQVETLQRAQVEAGLPTHIRPRALWSVTDLPSLLGEDGTVSTDLVTEAITRAEAEFGLAPKLPTGVRLSINGRRGVDGPRTGLAGMAEAIRG